MNFNREQTLFELISKFENMLRQGTVTNIFDEKDYFKLIDYFEKEYQTERALEVVDCAIQSPHQYSSSFYIRKAQILIKHNRETEAMYVLDDLRQLAPYNLTAELLRAEAFISLGLPEDALRICDKLKDRNLTSIELSEIYVLDAMIYQKLNQHETMFFSLKAALKENPKNASALDKLWCCVEVTRKYEESIVLHEAVINEDPYSYLAWYNLGHAHQYLGNYVAAQEAYEYAYIINEKFEFAYRDCAEVCFILGDYERALRCYQEVIQHFDVDSDIFMRIGQCYQSLKRYDIAQNFYNHAYRMDPYNDEVSFHKGECFAKSNKWKEAIESYKIAIGIEDKREEYMVAMAEACFHIGNYKQAERYHQKATTLAPEFSEYWIRHARFLMSIGKTATAIEVLDQAEKTAPGTELMYCRAVCLLLGDQRSEALRMLSDALVEDYSLHDAIFELAPDLEKDTDVMAVIAAHLLD